MSDTTTGTEAIERAASALATPDAETTTPLAEVDETDANLGDAGKQALDRMKAERNEAKRQSAELKAQLDKLEAANMSELERAQKEAKDAQEIAAKATRDALRYRIAAESGITENTDLILTASDEETMRKQAALWSQQKPVEQPRTAPRADLTQGSQAPPALNSDALTEALARAVGKR